MTASPMNLSNRAPGGGRPLRLRTRKVVAELVHELFAGSRLSERVVKLARSPKKKKKWSAPGSRLPGRSLPRPLGEQFVAPRSAGHVPPEGTQAGPFICFYRPGPSWSTSDSSAGDGAHGLRPEIGPTARGPPRTSRIQRPGEPAGPTPKLDEHPQSTRPPTPIRAARRPVGAAPGGPTLSSSGTTVHSSQVGKVRSGPGPGTRPG